MWPCFSSNLVMGAAHSVLPSGSCPWRQGFPPPSVVGYGDSHRPVAELPHLSAPLSSLPCRVRGQNLTVSGEHEGTAQSPQPETDTRMRSIRATPLCPHTTSYSFGSHVIKNRECFPDNRAMSVLSHTCLPTAKHVGISTGSLHPDQLTHVQNEESDPSNSTFSLPFSSP